MAAQPHSRVPPPVHSKHRGEMPHQKSREVDQFRAVRFLSLISEDFRQPTLRGVCRRRLVAIQADIYRFLERPSTVIAHLYHFAVFVLIALVCILTAIAEHSSEHRQLLAQLRWLELAVTLYLLTEFFVRFWAAGASARFNGFRGRLVYVARPACLIDLLVLSSSFFLLFIPAQNREEEGNGNRFECLEKLRFVQILRLLHVDRQLDAFALVRRMLRRSRFELLSAYYISFMVFLTMDVCVFTAEQWLEEQEQQQGEEDKKKTFRHFGDSLWFSIVTMLTIGYGDIVPRHWLSKVTVCLLSYLGLSMFSAASGLVGVGMSLMVNGKKQRRQQSKVRHLAARLIQNWARFHLVSDRQRFTRIRLYRRLCVRLQRTEERIGKGREMVRLAAERKSGIVGVLLHKYSLIQQQEQPPEEMIWDDEERILDFYYNQQRSHSDSLLSNRSDEVQQQNGRMPPAVEGDQQSRRYRPILRMCYFLVFMSLRDKFKRARSPYGLIDAEAELGELEHQRTQKFKELELRLDAQLGRNALASRERAGTVSSRNEGSSSEFLPVLERMEMCEQKVAEMTRKAEFIEQLAEQILTQCLGNGGPFPS